MLAQFITSISFAIPVSIIFALSAHGTEINPTVQPDCSTVVCTQDSSDLQTLTPMTKVDCSKVLCTTDGIGQPKQESIVLPAPYIGVETEQ